jgi:hypothetical protein
MPPKSAAAQVYRALLKACREADGYPALAQELVRRPLPALQAASAQLDRQALNLVVEFDPGPGVPEHLLGGRLFHLPWRDVVLRNTEPGGDEPKDPPAPGGSPAVPSSSSSSSSSATALAASLSLSKSSMAEARAAAQSVASAAVEAPSSWRDVPRAGDAVCALHPDFGPAVMAGGAVFWDATVAATLPEVGVILQEDKGGCG